MRVVYVDMMRGIAILLVVAAHLIQTNVVEGVNTKAFMFINSFHMPLFFSISGYIAQKVYMPLGGAKDVLLFIMKKMIALMIPLFVWDLFVYRFFLTGSWNWLTIDDFLHEFTHPRLWFLLTLFLIFVGFSIFSLLSNRWNKKQSILQDLCIIVIIFALYGLYYICHLRAVQVILYSIPFYIGVMIARYKKIEKIASNNYIIALSFLFFCILVGHWDMWSDSYIDDIIKNIIDPCAFIVILNTCKLLEINRLSAIICQWGRCSMEIYVAHWAMLELISGYRINMDSLNQIWLLCLSILMALPIVYACMLLGKVSETAHVLRLVLYGKRA